MKSQELYIGGDLEIKVKYSILVAIPEINSKKVYDKAFIKLFNKYLVVATSWNISCKVHDDSIVLI